MNDQIIADYLLSQEEPLNEYELPLPEELWQALFADYTSGRITVNVLTKW